MHSLRAEMVLHHPFNQQTCISVLSVGDEMNDQVPTLLGSHRNKVYCQNIFHLFLCYWKISWLISLAHIIFLLVIWKLN